MNVKLLFSYEQKFRYSLTPAMLKILRTTIRRTEIKYTTSKIQERREIE